MGYVMVTGSYSYDDQAPPRFKLSNRAVDRGEKEDLFHDRKCFSLLTFC